MLSTTSQSDKFTWHRYTDFYEPFLRRVHDATAVLEFGVFHGASVRYLHDRYPQARIVGCDILPVQRDWPTSERISYKRLDQGSTEDLHKLFGEEPGPYDLVIEDGSHEPEHQRNCLVACLPHVRAGGVYVLEDLHTSHPAHPSMGRRQRRQVNCLHLLLAFEHLRATGTPLSDRAAERLSSSSLFTADEVRELFDLVAEVHLYRRAALPLACYRCGGEDFAYEQLRCTCGTTLLDEADSISAALVVGDSSARTR